MVIKVAVTEVWIHHFHFKEDIISQNKGEKWKVLRDHQLPLKVWFISTSDSDTLMLGILSGTF